MRNIKIINYKTIIVFILLLITNDHIYSQKTVRIQKTDNPPVLDGKVDDACWATSALINEFIQREPREGEPLTEKTEVFVCYNADYIYFGVKCYQEPGTVIAKELKWDASMGTDDRIAIMLDTYLDRRNAYFFGLNANGAREDAIVTRDGMNRSWNGVWIGKSQITEIGWEAEWAIPFKSIGFNKKSDRWGLLINRFIKKKLEWGTWPVGNINSSQFQMSDAGIIEGLEGITQGIGLDIAPYFITGLDNKREQKADFKINAGTDVFYQVTPSLKASLSVNTDFAETEADARQINLTRFSLRLAEKRNFFLDGSNYFSFGLDGRSIEPPSGKINPFFSRTIGLDANGSPIPVNYGAKLTGRVSNWNIGMLHVSDNRDYGNSHFSVARVNYNFGDQSSVGMISTFGNSKDSTRNVLGGLDLKLASSKFMGNKHLSLNLFGIKSGTDNIHGKDVSWGGSFSYPNDFLNFRIGHIQIGENFIAGMGYVPRSNIRETFGSLTIGPRLNKYGIRQVTFGGSFDYVTNFANQLQSKEMTINPLGILFESGESFDYSLVHNYDFLEKDFNIYSDYIIPPDEYQWWTNRFSLSSERSRAVNGSISYNFGRFYTGSQKSAGITANWKIAVSVFIGGSYNTNIVKLPDGEFTANIYEINFNLLFSPDLTLYNYFQYDSQSEVIGLQSVFQWIIKPGNEILFVWNSGYTKPLERYSLNENSLRFKIKYNIRF